MSEPGASGVEEADMGEVSAILQRSAGWGFLGGMPISDQISHALGFAAAVEGKLGRSPTSLLDLGSGGGIPGLVLVARWTTARIVLFDASDRRTDFLRRELEEWGVSGRVDVVRGRAEEASRDPSLREQFEVVTARSFGSPAVTAECGSPFVELGGWLVVSEPPDDSSTTRWPNSEVPEVGLDVSSTFRFEDRFGYQLLAKSTKTPDRYPRRTGVPAKRPLF